MYGPGRVSYRAEDIWFLKFIYWKVSNLLLFLTQVGLGISIQNVWHQLVGESL